MIHLLDFAGHLNKCRLLVGYFVMSDPLFEPFREWIEVVRGRKGSKKPLNAAKLGGARMPLSRLA
jgi:hypothetical protein